jgi:beta-aspartyl-peptidase (threonine type)
VAIDPSLIRLALHGGTGESKGVAIDRNRRRAALRTIIQDVWGLLQSGASAVDATVRAVELLEECPLFNAGIGAVLTQDGLAELDAAVMDGAMRECGAVACVTRVKSPVRLARAIMERTPFNFFVGSGAETLAAEWGLELVDPGYFITEHRLEELRVKQTERSVAGADGTDTSDRDLHSGTVGAVARDGFGHLAAATSTGGMTNKPSGRIGDSPIIGAGTFADDSTLAVSCTGMGEAFIRSGFAFAVHSRLAFCDWEVERACAEALASVRGFGGSGGCIAIDHSGNIALPFNSREMYRAWIDSCGTAHVAVGVSEHSA